MERLLAAGQEHHFPDMDAVPQHYRVILGEETTRHAAKKPEEGGSGSSADRRSERTRTQNKLLNVKRYGGSTSNLDGTTNVQGGGTSVVSVPLSTTSSSWAPALTGAPLVMAPSIAPPPPPPSAAPPSSVAYRLTGAPSVPAYVTGPRQAARPKERAL